MRVFLWTIMVLNGLGVLARLAHLVRGEYPRTQETGSGEDGIAAVLGVAFVAWALYLLSIR
jgi:hypothetical protein